MHNSASQDWKRSLEEAQARMIAYGFEKKAEFLCDLAKVSDRAALLLPEYAVDSPLDQVPEAARALRGKDPATLEAILENPAEPVHVRYAAGQILALEGDPRIDTLRPEMLLVDGCDNARIGLDPDEVAGVLEAYEDLALAEKWIRKECPSFEVSIASFKIARYPVTNQEYLQFLKETRRESLPTAWPLGRYPVELANHPVHSVAPEDAEAYAAWLSAKTGLPYRLPTEYEWEYAAAGKDRLEFPWGNAFDRERCNTVELDLLATTPVGMFALGKSWCGADDLAGNVEEYVADDYHVYPGGEHQVDHLNESGQSYRVARGGSFARFRDLARCKRRHGWFKRNVFPMGFRLALSLQ